MVIHVLGAALLLVGSLLVGAVSSGEIRGLASVGIFTGLVLLLGHAVRLVWSLAKYTR